MKVKWLLDRLGRDYHWIETDVTTGVTRSPQFLALNAAGQTPTIVLEDGRPMAQSNAIIVHMAEGTDLIPADAFDRAKMFEWLFWEQYSHEPYIAVVRFKRAIAGQSKAEIEPRLMERGYAALARMEVGLTGRDWLVGEAVSLADLALVAYTGWRTRAISIWSPIRRSGPGWGGWKRPSESTDPAGASGPPMV